MAVSACINTCLSCEAASRAARLSSLAWSNDKWYVFNSSEVVLECIVLEEGGVHFLYKGVLIVQASPATGGDGAIGIRPGPVAATPAEAAARPPAPMVLQKGGRN